VPVLNLDLDEYFKSLTHMKTLGAEAGDEGDNNDAPVKVDVAALRWAGLGWLVLVVYAWWGGVEGEVEQSLARGSSRCISPPARALTHMYNTRTHTLPPPGRC
jgi:hypothetical protein